MDNDQLIKEQLQKLPTELQKALEAVPWKAAVKEISLTQKLSPEQASAVEQETMLILYGFDDPKNYVDNLVKEAKLDENTALTLAELVNEKILKPISAKADELSKNISVSTAPADLPMVEAGEKVHDVPHDKKLDAMPARTTVQSGGPKSVPAAPVLPQSAPQPAASVPKAATSAKTRPNPDTPVVKSEAKPTDYRYPGGKDPYREPIE